jgi:multimeric flavodoxin WrbA
MSKKRVVIVIGSPRIKGNSSALAQQVAEGIKDSGAKAESFFLHGMEIKPCTACDVCLENSSKDCIIEDDMKTLYPKLRQADALVIASPIYWFTVSAQTKLFVDRCYALEGPEGNALKGKRIGIILTYADPDPFSSGAVNALRTFQDTFNYIGAVITGMIYGSAEDAGEIRENKDLMRKAYQLGQRIVAGGED